MTILRRGLLIFLLTMALPGIALAQHQDLANRTEEVSRTSGMAQERPDVVEADRLMAAGQAAAAYSLLYSAFVAEPQNGEINFHLGRAAYAKGDYEAAVMAFERVLIIDSGAVAAKLELGKSFYRLGSLATADQYFDEVLAANPPAEIKQTLEAFRAGGEEL